MVGDSTLHNGDPSQNSVEESKQQLAVRNYSHIFCFVPNSLQFVCLFVSYLTYSFSV